MRLEEQEIKKGREDKKRERMEYGDEYTKELVTGAKKEEYKDQRYTEKEGYR